MERSGLQRVIPAMLILLVVAAAIAGLFSVGQSMFGGGEQTEQVNKGKEALTKTKGDMTVRMTVRGPIVGNEDFYSYRVTVKPNSRNMTTYVGYLKRPIDTKVLGNNTKAYEQLVYALDYARLMDGMPFTGEADDTRGVCATGEVYEYEVLDGSTVVQRLWTTTCDGFRGSLKATRLTVTNLFHKQIPEYYRLLSKIDF